MEEDEGGKRGEACPWKRGHQRLGKKPCRKDCWKRAEEEEEWDRVAEKGEKRTAWNKDAGVISFVIFIFFSRGGKALIFRWMLKIVQ